MPAPADPPPSFPILFLNPQTSPARLQAQLQHLIWVNISVTLAVGVVLYLAFPNNHLWQLGGILAVIHLLMLGLLQVGYLRLALYLLPIGLLGTTWLGAVWTEDHQGFFVGFFGLGVLTTAALLGSRATAVAVLFSIIASIQLFLAPTEAVWLPIRLSIIWATAQLVVFGLIGHFAMRKLVLSLLELQQNNQTLTHIQHQLEEQQAALARSEQTKKAILASIPDMMALISKEGEYLEYQALQYFREEDPPESVVGLTVHDKLSPNLAAQRMAYIAQALSTRQMITYEESQSVRGQAHFFSTRIMAVDDERVLVMMRDITEEKQQEAANLAAQKVESVGLLAGGVAHDFNNLLTGMMTQTSLALAKLEPDAPPAKHILKANIAAERAADLTRQLLAYAGQGSIHLETLDLNGLIRENVSLIQASLPVQVDIEIQFGEQPLWIEADRGHVHQVVMNLIINAAEAIHEAGTIYLSTEWMAPSAVPDVPYTADHRTQPDQPHICLCVSDTGIGIGPDTMVRIFDPFFSKKKEGRGLGLSATLGIIRRYGGAILLDSTPGHGTTFWVLWPPKKV